MANEGAVPQIVEPTPATSEERDKVDPIKQSELEMQAKYPGLKPKVKSVAQRKISSGGTQYFDSGEYNAASTKEKPKIASNPNAAIINPAMLRLRGPQRAPGKLPLSPLSGPAPIPPSARID